MMCFRKRLSTWTLSLLVFVIFEDDCGICHKLEPVLPDEYRGSHKDIVERYFMKRNALNTSNVGTILFKNVPPESFRQPTREGRTYNVLVWKLRNHVPERFVGYYKRHGTDPLAQCSVKNCIFHQNVSELENADAVVFMSMQWPNLYKRKKDQKWVFLTDENPDRMFFVEWNPHKPTMGELAEHINWTMTYRTHADVPVPYGRTIPLAKPMFSEEEFAKAPLNDIIPYWAIKKHDVWATVVWSHKEKYRMKFLNDLRKYLKVDVYGNVFNKLKKVCPPYRLSSCNIVDRYLFYLSFENRRCREYITEKVFYNAYLKGAIPVVLGAPLKDCEMLLPPKSFIHVEQFNTVEDLAEHLQSVAEDPEALREYHRWRNHFKVVNEHGFFNSQSLHYCRLCEALNYNEEESIYNEEKMKNIYYVHDHCINNVLMDAKWVETAEGTVTWEAVRRH